MDDDWDDAGQWATQRRPIDGDPAEQDGSDEELDDGGTQLATVPASSPAAAATGLGQPTAAAIEVVDISDDEDGAGATLPHNPTDGPEVIELFSDDDDRGEAAGDGASVIEIDDSEGVLEMFQDTETAAATPQPEAAAGRSTTSTTKQSLISSHITRNPFAMMMTASKRASAVASLLPSTTPKPPSRGGGTVALRGGGGSASARGSSGGSGSSSRGGKSSGGQRRQGGGGGMFARPVGECPFWKKVPGTDVIVDGFQWASASLSSSYVLTHFHSDHYIGLQARFDCGTIYCSPITGDLLQMKIKIRSFRVKRLPMDTPTKIATKQGDAMVTLIDANHCPGAAMFLFQLPGGAAYLHVGDFRWSPTMVAHPLLAPYVAGLPPVAAGSAGLPPMAAGSAGPAGTAGDGEGGEGGGARAMSSALQRASGGVQPTTSLGRNSAVGGARGQHAPSSSSSAAPLTIPRKRLTRLYLDTTYCDASHCFPAQNAAIEAAMSLVRQYARDPGVLFLFGAYSIGKERIYFEAARELKARIHVSEGRMKMLRACVSPEDAALLTTDATQARIRVISTSPGAFPMGSAEALLKALRKEAAEEIAARGGRPPSSTGTGAGGVVSTAMLPPSAERAGASPSSSASTGARATATPAGAAVARSSLQLPPASSSSSSSSLRLPPPPPSRLHAAGERGLLDVTPAAAEGFPSGFASAEAEAAEMRAAEAFRGYVGRYTGPAASSSAGKAGRKKGGRGKAGGGAAVAAAAGDLTAASSKAPSFEDGAWDEGELEAGAEEAAEASDGGGFLPSSSSATAAAPEAPDANSVLMDAMRRQAAAVASARLTRCGPFHSIVAFQPSGWTHVGPQGTAPQGASSGSSGGGASSSSSSRGAVGGGAAGAAGKHPLAFNGAHLVSEDTWARDMMGATQQAGLADHHHPPREPDDGGGEVRETHGSEVLERRVMVDVPELVGLSTDPVEAARMLGEEGGGTGLVNRTRHVTVRIACQTRMGGAKVHVPLGSSETTGARSSASRRGARGAVSGSGSNSSWALLEEEQQQGDLDPQGSKRRRLSASAAAAALPKGGLTLFSVPYSEHSSWGELLECVAAFRPLEIVPTVNCRSAGEARALVARLLRGDK